MKPIRLLKEPIIILSVFIIIVLFVWFSVGRNMDMTIGDSYFVIKTSWLTSVLSPFLWLVTIIYLIRARINHFKNTLQNIILLVGCIGLNIMMLCYFKITAEFTSIATRESALSKYNTHSAPQPTMYSSDSIMMQILFIIQIILMLLLVIIAVITGKNYKTNVQEIL